MPTYQIALMCLIGVIFFGFIIFFIVYRRLTWERDLRNMSWRVTFADVTFLSARADSFKLSMLDVGTMATMETDDDECKHSFTRVGLHQGVQVALKRIPVDTIDLTRQILLEIKMVRDLHHDNLTRFIGVCIEPQNNFVLNEYCSKGSLQDVLLNDSIKLDWTFRLSLLIDIAKAMKFLHHSPVQFHGRLRSTNCVVDSRFGLKVTDFGLLSFFPPTVVTDHEDNYHAMLEKLLWLAPEHLSVYCSGYRQTGGSQKGDVYGFGIIMEEVTLRSVPYDTQRGLLSVTEILDKVMKRENPPHRPKVPQREAPAQLNSLMDRCWSDVADLRPTFDVILKSLKSLTHGREVNLMETLITRLEDYASNLEDVVEDRTRQLAEEKKNSEMLLYQILPQSVADQLKRGEPVTPEMYDNVTIYFSDIVGFTAMSAKCFPMQVVSFLNDLYSAFDSVIDDHDVYKVETIGDAYMVVSGLPERKGDQHAVEICRMALGLLQLAQTFPIRHSPGETLQLRVGIHSGPCCAGVVGKKMPRCCLFGDTVNTASRMESTGQPLKIHLSETAKRILDGSGNFITQYRGPVEMKL
ncbi:atrial natriuretic peptide receptor 2-like [Littorina saxatilis]|uniref:atrial natriuretic peptide receptor 2-like n=1 Tax=Littorina saxatilis TaxID=31220 RepID=UPI0038B63ABC